MIEFWRSGGGFTTIEAVKAAEAEGWDGQMFQDSLSLSPNPYVVMGACAIATDKIKLSTGVTNPLTRHIALTASGAAALQAISGGRAVLGIGRGGLVPTPLAAFEQALTDLQTLLNGGKIVAWPHAPTAGAPPPDSRSLDDRPASGMDWLPQGLPKVPLDVAATGPKVIDIAAPLAERVTFSVGAIPERIDWALGVARAARAGKGLTDTDASYGAQIIVVCHPDRNTAQAIATSMVPPLSRFQVIQGLPGGPMSPSDAQNFAAICEGYKKAQQNKNPEAIRRIGKSLTPDFIERFAVVGPPNHCIERLVQLVRLGLERFVVVGPGFYPEPGGSGGSLFVREVMPAVRAAAGG